MVHYISITSLITKRWHVLGDNDRVIGLQADLERFGRVDVRSFCRKVKCTNVMFSVSKLTIVDMKLSFMTTERMPFHVSPFSPSSVQMDSSAILTTEGGLAIERTSTSCCFLMERTAVGSELLAILRYVFTTMPLDGSHLYGLSTWEWSISVLLRLFPNTKISLQPNHVTISLIF